MAKRTRKKNHTKRKQQLVAYGVAGAVLAVAIPLVVLGGFGSSDAIENFYRAWYLDTAEGPIVVVSHGSHTGPSYGSEPRYDSDAVTTMSLYAHRVSDGKYLGRYRSDKYSLAGVWRDKLWIYDDKAGPLLVTAADMKIVADRKAIHASVGDAVGGDFEMSRPGGFVDGYTGRLAINGADGKYYWVTTDLRVEARDPNARLVPAGWYCSVGRTDLIKARMTECLPPSAAPATALVLSRKSALQKDANLPPILSGVAARYEHTEVLWSVALDELVGAGAPYWLGAQTVGPRRVLLMVRTDPMQLHLIFVDPTDGAVLERKTMFSDSPPGPG